jgi:DNA polymerase-1
MSSQSNKPRLMLIDGFGLIFRAYHAVPPGLVTSRGELTNATFGFTSMLLEVLRREMPQYIVMAFDTGRTFRHDDYVEYKANRSEMPEDLRGQLARIREIVEALGISIHEAVGFEADDVIGTLARQAEMMGLEVLIITGDNDLLQLVNKHTHAALPGAGPKARFSEVRYFDVDKVKEKYTFSPEYIPDYKAITGDKSDNIPGIPGLGEVTARKLINLYGHLENIYAHLAEVKPPKVQTALETFREQALKSKYLATIVTEVPVKLDLDMARAHQMDRDRVVTIFREVEFRSLLNHLPDTPAIVKASTKVSNKNEQLNLWDMPEVAPEASETKPETESKYKLIRDSAALAKLVERVRQTGVLAFDTETTSEDPMRANLVGVSIAPAPDESYYIPIGHVKAISSAVFELLPDQLEWEDVRPVLEELFNDSHIRKIAHHAKYDLAILQRHGMALERLDISFDTMLAAQIAGKTSSRLKDLAFEELGVEMTRIDALIGSGKNQTTMDRVPIETAGQYAAADADNTLKLVSVFEKDLSLNKLEKVFHEIEMPLIPVLTGMELVGVALDTARLGTLSTSLYQKISELEKNIFNEVGHQFNINSPDQLGKVLFEELGLQGGKKTATKKFSTDKKTLDTLRGAHAVVDLVLEYRQFGKLKSTYVDSLPLLLNLETGRVHTSFQQIGASSGRMSSNNPNLQNIPIRTEIGREVRRAFIADNSSNKRLFGNDKAILVSADYSQIELRLLAHLTGDERLTSAFLANKDIHRATAADVFGIPEEQVTDDMRRVAKTVNFGIIYGLSAFGLTQQINITYQEAAAFIENYKAKYPSVWHYLESTPEEARKTGFVQTLFGRRRYMPELNAGNPILRKEAERAAINMPVQGTAADIVKIAMRRVWDALNSQKLRAKLLLQVHDELVFEAPESELPELAALVHTHMEAVEKDVQLSVPLKADLKYGLNWGEMEKYAL